MKQKEKEKSKENLENALKYSTNDDDDIEDEKNEINSLLQQLNN